MVQVIRGLFVAVLASQITACATDAQLSRPLSEIETKEIQNYLGTYNGNVYSRRTKDPEAKPLISGVKLDLAISKGTLVLTSDKDLSGGDCPTEIGRFTSLNFATSSMVATFDYTNTSCSTPLNVEGLTIEARSTKDGDIKLTTRTPKVIPPKRAAKGTKKSGFNYGSFMKDREVSAETDQSLEE